MQWSVRTPKTEAGSGQNFENGFKIVKAGDSTVNNTNKDLQLNSKGTPVTNVSPEIKKEK